MTAAVTRGLTESVETPEAAEAASGVLPAQMTLQWQEQQFRASLVAMYRRAGSPTYVELAQRKQVPPARFQFLSEPLSTGLPDQTDMAAFLDAIAVPAVEARQLWSHWSRLNRQRKALAEEKRAPQPDGLLATALQARSAEQFTQCLRELRTKRKLSYLDIERKSQGQLPKSTAHHILKPGNLANAEHQVRYFVMACGATPAEALLWVKAWLRATQLYDIPGVGDSGDPSPTRCAARPRPSPVTSRSWCRASATSSTRPTISATAG